MPTNEKEYNGYLFDQLEIVESTLKILKKGDSAAAINYLEDKKAFIERKLYQKPPLSENK